MGTIMNWQPIHKQRAAGAIQANLDNYERARALFSWEKMRDELAGPDATADSILPAQSIGTPPAHFVIISPFDG